MDKKELKIIKVPDTVIRRQPVRAIIDSIIPGVETKLTQNPEALLSWEPVPLATYDSALPAIIHSSWVFVLRAQVNTGAERHPNSHQRTMSYRGSGDLQIWDGERCCSNILINDLDAAIENRWISIPPNKWHQALVPEENWVVISFHTVPEDELIEERPDPIDSRLTLHRRYLDKLR